MGILRKIKKFFQLNLENEQEEKPKEQKEEINIENLKPLLSKRGVEIEKAIQEKK